MNQEERKKIKEIAFKKESLSKLSKYKRAEKDPKILILFFFPWFIAKYIRPIKVNYKTLWGDKMKFYLPEGNVLVSKGFFELNLFNFFLNFIKEGDVVVDIGAHVGSYTKLSSRLVGDSGKVYAFEPTPRTFKTLWENTRYDKNIITNNFALLDEERNISFEDYGPKYSYFNGFKKRTDKEVSLLESKKIEVQAITLDNYFLKNKIDRCDFIKIDAEGAESLILKGASNVLGNIKPVISIEVGGGMEWLKNNQDSIEILLSKGYLMFEINKEGYLYEHIKKDFYIYDNLIAIHIDKIEYVRALIKN